MIFSTDGWKRLSCLATLLGISLLCGCQAGGIHRAGDRQVAITGTFGTAIKGNVVWPDAEGRSDNAALVISYNHFFHDRWAFMIAGTPYKIYNQQDGDVYAGEFQIGFRYFITEFDVFGMPTAIYAEMLGGLLQGARSVPEEGSQSNFTHDTGIGFEMKLSDAVSWIAGYKLKHLSNGNFQNDDNPAQNDNHVYTGIAIALPK